MSDGTRQSQRLSALLAADALRADELRFEDLVAMCAGFGAALKFHDLDNRPAGTWGALFDADESLVLARILSFDRAARQARLLEDFDATPIEALVREIGDLAHTFDGWLEKLEVIDEPAAQGVGRFMADMVQRHLREGLASVWRPYRSLEGTSRAAAHAVAGRIRIAPPADEAGAPRSAALEWPERKRLRSQLASIAGAIARLQEFARARLPLSLRSQVHDPAAGMLIAFLRLFQAAQQRINAFTHRHARFYYDECLRARPAEAIPDRVHLVLVRDPLAKREVVVARGTLFSAGKDAQGRDIAFRADEERQVSDARVAALCSLRLERDPLISPEHDFRFVTRAIASRIYPPETQARAAAHWLLFGGSDSSGDRGTGEPAQIGLAIASRQFFLKEGRREIRVTLRFEERMETDADVQALAGRHAAQMQGLGVFLERWLQGPIERILAVHPEWLEGDGAGAHGSAAELAGRAAAAFIEAIAGRPERSDDYAFALEVLGGCFPALREAAFVPHADVDMVLRRLAAEMPAKRKVIAAQLESLHAPLARLFARYLALEPALRSRGGEPAEKQAGELAKLAAARFAGRSDRSPLAYFRLFLILLLITAPNAETFSIRLGILLRRWLLDEQDWLGERELQQIRAAYERLSEGDRGDATDRPAQADEGDPLCLILGARDAAGEIVYRRPDRDLIHDRLFSRLFTVSATIPGGWLEIADAYAIRPAAARGAARRGLTLVVPLQPKEAPVVGCIAEVHGRSWQTGFPVLRLQLSTTAQVYGYSLLDGMLLSEVEIAVEVSEARDTLLNNNLGRLDPSKPFQPFGPLPGLSSYVVVGSPEIARKNLTALTLNLSWEGLPRDDGGFESYYRGYDSAFDNQTFAVGISLLRDGQWKRLGNESSTQYLFASEEGGYRLARHSRIRVDEAALGGQFQPSDPAVPGEAIPYGIHARNGFLKFQLASPAWGFGHGEYPALLSRVLAANGRLKKPLPLPNPPYTPSLDRLTLDYRAASTIRPGRVPSASDRNPEKIFHLHPFGVREIHPAPISGEPTLLPHYAHDGTLFIGIAGGEPGATISLLFHLRDEAAATHKHGNSLISWSYLAGNEWRELAPERVLADTTYGFLTTGIVRIALPPDIDRGHSVLADGMLWLGVSADIDFECFADLYGVRTHAITATRATGGAEVVQGLSAGTIREPVESIPGLAGVEQVGASFGMRSAETMPQLYTRIGERLRHKNRAATPWDYECLVLERFPDVFKVKCFRNLVSPSLEASGKAAQGTGDRRVQVLPGHVLVVVVPAQGGAQGPVPRLNAIELKRIREYLAAVNSPCARLNVRNAAYERIQVRCTVELERDAQVGMSLQLISQALESYLSPWQEGGYDARFDWVIRREDVETHIRALGFVKSVSGLSLLRIAEDDYGDYTLDDTARAGQPAAAGPARIEVRPRLPWSIAVPAGWHIIETAHPGRVAAPPAVRGPRPVPTGIGQMGIGSTFVVGRSDG